MNNLTYSEQLQHPMWQRKRLEIMQRDGFQCQCCLDSETTLNVHHKQYIKGRKVWDYTNDYLVTLCRTCHENHHEVDISIREILSSMPFQGPGSLNEAKALIAGWAASFLMLDVGRAFDENPQGFAVGCAAQVLSDLTFGQLEKLILAMRDVEKEVLVAEIERFSERLQQKKAIKK
jgi:hypothetical protein